MEKPTLEIIVDGTDQHVKLAEKLKRITGTYLHGKLQNEVKYDIYSFLMSDPNYVIPLGIHECFYKEKPCLFYYWKARTEWSFGCGLVVYADDTKSIEYAQDCYKNKKEGF
jgi:hypothetical protein